DVSSRRPGQRRAATGRQRRRPGGTGHLHGGQGRLRLRQRQNLRHRCAASPSNRDIVPRASQQALGEMTMKCFVRVMLWLSLSLVMSPAVEAQELEHDPFQRRLVFYNDTPVTIWPVFQAPQDSNCKAELGSKLLRIHVNSQTRDRGIPPGESVTVALPKRWPCK